MQSNQGQSDPSQQSWGNQEPYAVRAEFEIGNPSQVQDIAAAAVQVPGIGFRTYQDQQTGRQKVSLEITREASQRFQQVQQLHQQLLALSLGQNQGYSPRG